MRRLLVAPLMVVVALAAVVTSPVLLLVAAVFSYRLPGHLRALRLLGFAYVYLVVELCGLVVAFVLWVASGFGWRLRSPGFRSAHYAVLRWALSVLYAAGRRLFALTLVADDRELPSRLDLRRGRPAPARPEVGGEPLVVMSRHAGPADSMLIVHELMTWVGRHPRIVLKKQMQLDPLVDVLLNRLPNRFVDTQRPGDDVLDAITALAAGMGPDDAFLIFPEGGNFTEARRTRAIEHLRSLGMVREAERAERLQYVLPPRPGGVLTAIDACPTADVVLVAHTGLDALETVHDIWTAIPDHKELRFVWRVEPAASVPTDPEARIDWLYDGWADVDAWIAQHRVVEAAPARRQGRA
jgi:hypothetical protein